MNSNTGLRILPQLLQRELPRGVETALEHILGIREVINLYRRLQNTPGTEALLDSLLNELRVTATASSADLANVPRSGPVAVVANHPFGLLDGALLATTVMKIRPDVKVLANAELRFIPQLRDVLIPVDVIGSEAVRNARGLRAAVEHMAQGGALIVFPAGRVARSAEAAWSPTVSRLIELASRRGGRIQIVPTRVQGSNSLSFRLAAKLHDGLCTALLARELLNKRGRTVEVRFGRSVNSDALEQFRSHEERIEYLRWRSLLLSHRETYKPITRARVRGNFPGGAAEPMIAPERPEALRQEIERLDSEPLAVSGEMCAWVATARQIPTVLREIGRLREIAFRAVGEGTGKAVDLDSFDSDYLHLFVWNDRTNEVVGAYRLKRVDADTRTGAMYTASLFRYGREFLDRLGPAIELGRSFVRPEYQRNLTPLLLLWKGICRFVYQHPQYKVLFGPVSISNTYSETSRQLIVSFLEQRNCLVELARFVAARNPFGRNAGMRAYARDVDDLSDAVADIESAGQGVPVLLRQYLKLGGKLVGFNVDRDFGHALDGLIVVDLTRTEPRLLERYFGKAEAASFLAFHRGAYGENANRRISELDAASDSRRHPSADTLLQVQWRA